MISSKLSPRHVFFTRIGTFVLFLVIGIATFYVATYIGVDKNTAFLGGVGMMSALTCTYVTHLKK